MKPFWLRLLVARIRANIYVMVRPWIIFKGFAIGELTLANGDIYVLVAGPGFYKQLKQKMIPITLGPLDEPVFEAFVGKEPMP